MSLLSPIRILWTVGLTTLVIPAQGHLRPSSSSAERLHQNHVFEALLDHKRIFESLESSFELVAPGGAGLFYGLQSSNDLDGNETSSNSSSASNSLFTNVDILKETFLEFFASPRSDEANATTKQNVRSRIIERFISYDLKVLTQNFVVRTWRRSRQIKLKGSNIIAILPGAHRGSPLDSITVLGAHYDTVSSCPGVDDNGSGSVVVMDIARIAAARSRRGLLNETLVFVLFDLEEWGALGSMAFVNHYLIKNELSNGTRFNGAYVMDMVLTFDRSENSQDLPSDIAKVVPNAQHWMSENKFRGDFLGVWSRSPMDTELFKAIESNWLDDSNYKLFPFDPQMPSTSNPADGELSKFETFLRSDHASFWYHKDETFNESLKAVLLTDMGPWRGLQRKCYHDACDDTKQLTSENLFFLKHTVDVLLNIICAR